jgi:hypothetical protein
MVDTDGMGVQNSPLLSVAAVTPPHTEDSILQLFFDNFSPAIRQNS